MPVDPPLLRNIFHIPQIFKNSKQTFHNSPFFSLAYEWSQGCTCKLQLGKELQGELASALKPTPS
jgi:hypothetical protein